MSDTGLVGRSVAGLRADARLLEREQAVLRFRQLRVYAELHERGFEALGFRGLPELVRADLRCSRSAARAVAVEVERFVGRNAVSGEVLDPVYPVAAGALSAGELGFEQARIIGDVIEALPVATQLEHAAGVERVLVEQAIELELEPEALRVLAKRVVGHLDPDGPEPGEDMRYRRRSFQLLHNYDGTGTVRGTLTATCLALLEAALGPLAAQHPPGPQADLAAQGDGGASADMGAVPGDIELDRDRAAGASATGPDPLGPDGAGPDELGPDARNPGQRYHDALEEAARRLLESGDLPHHAGLPAQLLITIDLRDLESRAGRATTHHGGTLTVEQALHLAADATVIPVILDQQLGLVAHGRGRRLADPKQRAVLFARDRGCTFPGCAMPAAQSQIHHMQDWLSFGATDPDNLTITCGYHNNESPRQGWKAHLVHGIPHWTPPPSHDPYQRPRRNYLHHPELLLPSRQ